MLRCTSDEYVMFCSRLDCIDKKYLHPSKTSPWLLVRGTMQTVLLLLPCLKEKPNYTLTNDEFVIVTDVFVWFRNRYSHPSH
jgi:hypothetical protein